MSLGQAVLINAILQYIGNQKSADFQKIMDLQGELNRIKEMSDEMNAINDSNVTPNITKWIAMNLRRLNERTTQINNRINQLQTNISMNEKREQQLEQQKQKALS